MGACPSACPPRWTGMWALERAGSGRSGSLGRKLPRWRLVRAKSTVLTKSFHASVLVTFGVDFCLPVPEPRIHVIPRLGVHAHGHSRRLRVYLAALTRQVRTARPKPTRADDCVMLALHMDHIRPHWSRQSQRPSRQGWRVVVRVPTRKRFGGWGSRPDRRRGFW